MQVRRFNVAVVLGAAACAATITSANPASAASNGNVRVFARIMYNSEYLAGSGVGPIVGNQQGVNTCHNLGAEVSSAINNTNGTIYFYGSPNCGGKGFGMNPGAKQDGTMFDNNQVSYKFVS